MSPGDRPGAGGPAGSPPEAPRGGPPADGAHDGADTAEWEHEVVLADGGTAFVRPVRPEDGDALRRLHARLSARSRYLRYFTARTKLPSAEIERAVRVDGRDRMAFAALDAGELVGFGRYDRTKDTDAAEVAFEIDDAHQGRGLGTLLLEHLAAWAHEQGLHRLTATVLPENRKMFDVFRDAGFPKQSHYEDGAVEVGLDIDPSRHTLEVIAARHRRALAKRGGPGSAS